MADRPPVEVAPHLLVRLAALPWAAADGLRSPDLAAAVDRLLGDAVDHVDDAPGTDAPGARAAVAAAGPESDDASVVPDDVATLADRAIARERAHLLQVVGSASFERAVAVSHPALLAHLRSHLRRFAPSVASPDGAPPTPTKSRHVRFESTLVNLVVRGAGRATPSGVWCGVHVAEVDDADAAGAWDVHDDPRVERLLVQVDLGPLAEAFRAATGRDLVVDDADCWGWLADAAAALSEPGRGSWQEATQQMRTWCEQMGDHLPSTTADAWVALHDDVARTVDRLRAGAGLPSVGAAPVLRVDWRLPLRARVSATWRDGAATAVDAWLRAQAAWGFGPLWAAATADALVPPSERATGRAVAVGREAPPTPPAGAGPAPTVGDPAGDPAGDPVGDLVLDGLPTVVGLVASIGDADHVRRAAALTHDFEQAVAAAPGGWPAASVLIDAGTPSPDVGAPRMGPWGSALLIRDATGFSVRSVRGDPALFQARWALIVPEVVDDAARAMARTPVAARSVHVTRYLNPSAALGAGMAPPLRSGPVGFRRVGAVQVGVVEAGDDAPVIPVIDTAAAPGTVDVTEVAVLRAASTWGWELVASGLPLSAAEVGAGGHLPALADRSGVTVHPERWLITQDELDTCARGTTALERFVAWRRLVGRRGLPDVLLVRLSPSPSSTHHLVLSDSILGVDAFLRRATRVAGRAVALRGPHPRTLLPGPGGAAHVAEVAVTFLDHEFHLDHVSGAD